MAGACAWLYYYWGGAEAGLVTADEMSRRAVTLAPDSAEAHAARALVLVIRGRPNEAMAEFRVALRLNPRIYKTHYAYARTCWLSGRVAEAARHLEQAEQHNPGYHGVPALLAKVYDRLGRTQDATRARRRCVERAEWSLSRTPGDARALYLGAMRWPAWASTAGRWNGSSARGPSRRTTPWRCSTQRRCTLGTGR